MDYNTVTVTRMGDQEIISYHHGHHEIIVKHLETQDAGFGE